MLPRRPSPPPSYRPSSHPSRTLTTSPQPESASPSPSPPPSSTSTPAPRVPLNLNASEFILFQKATAATRLRRPSSPTSRPDTPDQAPARTQSSPKYGRFALSPLFPPRDLALPVPAPAPAPRPRKKRDDYMLRHFMAEPPIAVPVPRGPVPAPGLELGRRALPTGSASADTSPVVEDTSPVGAGGKAWSYHGGNPRGDERGYDFKPFVVYSKRRGAEEERRERRGLDGSERGGFERR
ncbi:hypothetical protein EJ06DRAFT_10465 [Trichodelitschia bisporula]|uniref:Uncharacterized protein n=1 Tax=Trichodelitschia bisporula TaxID=703511 RepID=A0A6G1IAG4_9PEZI|nr:hypothetical protein EJ06DRAFT_10465 [Trichodelitschia bisporula]